MDPMVLPWKPQSALIQALTVSNAKKKEEVLREELFVGSQENYVMSVEDDIYWQQQLQNAPTRLI